MKNSKKQKNQSLISLAIVIAIIVVANIIAQNFYQRFDLTEDKRYTLGNNTREMLKELDDVVYVRVYLEGKDLPSGFKRLRNSTRDLLNEMRTHAGTRIEYEFIDPTTSTDAKIRNEIFQQLMDQGLEPVNLEVRRDGGSSQQIIFPGALVYYKNRMAPLSLLKSQVGVHPEEVLHNSIIGLEYEFASAIRRAQTSLKPRIAFITGQGELSGPAIEDLTYSLEEYYEVETIDLSAYRVGKLDEYKVVVIAKPDSSFSEVNKYKIDQYIMNGGKVLWLINSLHADMGDLQHRPETMTSDYPLNILEDQLFRYGVRINYNLVQSLQANSIPVITGHMGGQPRTALRRWVYFPLAYPANNHPIVNNLNAVWTQFPNSIDTVAAEGIKKTILLKTSPHSRTLSHPATINLQMAYVEPNPALFNRGPQNVAVLLEGEFTSVFRNRIAPGTIASGEYGTPIERSKPTRMIVVSDGNIARNQMINEGEQIFPLGYDRFTNQTFGNKNFIMNCIDYLVDESGLITLRTKDIKLRQLDSAIIKQEKSKWQAYNMSLPLVALVLFGLLYNYIRKRRYTT